MCSIKMADQPETILKTVEIISKSMDLSQEILVVKQFEELLELCPEKSDSYLDSLAKIGAIVQRSSHDEAYRCSLAASSELWQASKESLQVVVGPIVLSSEAQTCYVRSVRALILLMRNMSANNQEIPQDLLIQNVTIKSALSVISDQYDEIYMSLYTISLQFLHNITKKSVIFDASEIDPLMAYLEYPMKLKNNNHGLLLTYSMFFLNMTTSDDFLYYFVRHSLCQTILCDFLIDDLGQNYTNLLHHLKKNDDAEYEIKSMDAALLKSFANMSVNESFSTLLSTIECESIAQFFKLLRLVQLAVTSRESWNDFELTGLLSWCFPLFEKTAIAVGEYFNSCEEKLDSAQVLHNKLNISLDIIVSLSHFEHVQNYILSYNGLEKLVSLLRVLQNNLIRVNIHKNTNGSFRSMKTTTSTGDKVIDEALLDMRIDRASQKILPTNFPECKSLIIEIVAMLAYNRSAIKDKIRDIHGLELVLSNCVIDDNDPFIKERSIVCIKFLLQDNKENQDFVAKLEAKKAVQDDAISEAGYEINISDGGNVSLKPKGDKKKNYPQSVNENQP